MCCRRRQARFRARLIDQGNRTDKLETREVSSCLFTCLYVCIYVFMCPCVRVDFSHGGFGAGGGQGKRGEGRGFWSGLCMDRLVHRCVGKKTYQKIGVLVFNSVHFLWEITCHLVKLASISGRSVCHRLGHWHHASERIFGPVFASYTALSAAEARQILCRIFGRASLRQRQLVLQHADVEGLPRVDGRVHSR